MFEMESKSLLHIQWQLWLRTCAEDATPLKIKHEVIEARMKNQFSHATLCGWLVKP